MASVCTRKQYCDFNSGLFQCFQHVKRSITLWEAKGPLLAYSHNLNMQRELLCLVMTLCISHLLGSLKISLIFNWSSRQVCHRTQVHWCRISLSPPLLFPLPSPWVSLWSRHHHFQELVSSLFPSDHHFTSKYVYFRVMFAPLTVSQSYPHDLHIYHKKRYASFESHPWINMH